MLQKAVSPLPSHHHQHSHLPGKGCKTTIVSAGTLNAQLGGELTLPFPLQRARSVSGITAL